MERCQKMGSSSSISATLATLLLSLVAGCNETAGSLEPDRRITPAIQETTQETETPPVTPDQASHEQLPVDDQQSEPQWIGEPVSLFDGKSLEGWEVIEFGGQGDSTIENGRLAFEAGDPFTGISSTNETLPKTNYEVSLEARKMDGTDFFCGLTFPVADSHCTLIVGGWGGSTVGLSCIDGKDASSNETCTLMKFTKEQWYRIRIRVEPENLSVWIDDKQIVNQSIAGRKISLRGDTVLCEPLGICSFMTVAEYRNIQLREFKPIKKPVVTVPAESVTKPGTVKQE